jgi:hypothetical protein
MPPSSSRAIVEPTTLTRPSVRAPAPLRLAHRRERVGRLAALRDDDDERVGRDDRVAVAVLARVLHLDRDAAQLLDHHLADQRRVPARAARGDRDVVDLEQLVLRDVQPAQLREALLEQQAAAHRVLERLRLLEDLLEHEVVEAAALDLVEVPVDAVDLLGHLARVEAHHLVAVARDHRQLAVLEVHHVARVGEDGAHVARHEVLAVAHADEQRAPLARRDDLAGSRRASPRCRTCPRRAQRLEHRVLEAAVVRALDQVGEHLGVGLRGDRVARSARASCGWPARSR